MVVPCVPRSGKDRGTQGTTIETSYQPPFLFAQGTIGAGLLANGLPAFAEDGSGGLTRGDVAILRFPAYVCFESARRILDIIVLICYQIFVLLNCMLTHLLKIRDKSKGPMYNHLHINANLLIVAFSLSYKL